MLPDDERDAALHEALRIMRASGVSPRPEQHQRMKRRLLRRLAWDRRLSGARTVAAFLAGLGVGLLV